MGAAHRQTALRVAESPTAEAAAHVNAPIPAVSADRRICRASSIPCSSARSRRIPSSGTGPQASSSPRSESHSATRPARRASSPRCRTAADSSDAGPCRRESTRGAPCLIGLHALGAQRLAAARRSPGRGCRRRSVAGVFPHAQRHAAHDCGHQDPTRDDSGTDHDGREDRRGHDLGQPAADGGHTRLRAVRH